MRYGKKNWSDWSVRIAALQGGLWPALLPAELRDKPVEGLVATIYYGRPGTPMPPWQQFMTEAEAEWIVQKLMSGFPN